jgi:hypothetical protein
MAVTFTGDGQHTLHISPWINVNIQGGPYGSRSVL